MPPELDELAVICVGLITENDVPSTVAVIAGAATSIEVVLFLQPMMQKVTVTAAAIVIRFAFMIINIFFI